MLGVVVVVVIMHCISEDFLHQPFTVFDFANLDMLGMGLGWWWL